MRKMMNISFLLIVFGLFIQRPAAQINTPDSTGLPGDNFDLQGALQMFQQAASPEDFEKKINEKNNHVNNIDLNEDGEVDYIQVLDKSDKENHAFILQIAVSATETQDIAVIELEKNGPESAMIQIIGDEDIYGEQVIVEPGGNENDNSLIEGWKGTQLSGPGLSFNTNTAQSIIVNVWFWSAVRYVYAPLYVPWVSPWKWHFYPVGWHPWRPLAWHIWHPGRMVYHRNFIVVNTHRVIRAHKIYTPYRTTSVFVRTRHSNAVNNYRITRSKTTITGPRGRSATRTTTTVTGKRGKVKAKKTRIRKH
jgi:hypothetical protein